MENKTKHTPGPWTIHDNGDFTSAPTIRQAGAGVFVAQALCDHDECMSHDTMTANARLIAAAPELLEALRVIRETYASASGRGWAQVDAAIAKAEGRP